MVAVSKEERGLNRWKLARDDHAPGQLGIPTALFSIPHGFDPFRSLLEARFALCEGHWARNHPREGLEQSNG